MFAAPAGRRSATAPILQPATLLLVRHAHVAEADGPEYRMCGWFDPPLSTRGRVQAEALAARAATLGVSAVYTSPLRRARETAAPLAAALDLRPQLVADLREIHCGAVDGWPVRLVQARLPELWARNLEQGDDDFRWPAGESYREFRARSLGALHRLACEHPGQRVLVVTHCGVISQLLGSISGALPARWERFRPAHASLTTVEFAGDAGEVLEFNGLLPR